MPNQRRQHQRSAAPTGGRLSRPAPPPFRSDFTVMGANDHFMCTDVEWDPTGRYVFTAVSWWGHKIDNGFWLWTFQGRVVHRHNVQRMCNVQWRPRPKTLLSERQIKNIKKNLTKYGAQFDLKDKMRASRASKVSSDSGFGCAGDVLRIDA